MIYNTIIFVLNVFSKHNNFSKYLYITYMELKKKLYNLIKQKYHKDDFEIRDIVEYRKNEYGIKYYTTDGGYLFDFNGTLKELSEHIVGELLYTEKNYYECNFCGNKVLNKNLSNKCKNCGAICYKEQAHSKGYTTNERIKLYLAGGKISNISEMDNEDYLVWYLPKINNLEKIDENYIENEVNKILSETGKYHYYNDVEKFKLYFEKYIKENIKEDVNYGELLNNILGKIGIYITNDFYKKHVYEQYLELKKFETVSDYINKEYKPINFDFDMLDYSPVNHYEYIYDDFSNLYWDLEGIITKAILSFFKYDENSEDYEDIYEDIFDNSIDYKTEILVDYFENISIVEYLKIYNISLT